MPSMPAMTNVPSGPMVGTRCCAPVEQRVMSAIAWSRVIFVRWPSQAAFTDMRLDPDYFKAQKHRIESAEMDGNFVTIKRESLPTMISGVSVAAKP